MKRNIFLIFLIFISTFLSFGQSFTKEIDIKWNGVQTAQLTESIFIDFLDFNEAVNPVIFNEQPSILIYEKIDNNSSISYEVLSENWVELTQEEINILDADLVDNSLQINASTAISAKQNYAKIFILPFKQDVDGKYKRLENIKIQINVNPISQNTNILKHTWANSSVLASGKWYKVSVAENAVYQLTYSDFEQMGFDPSSIDPRNIKIYGNGGGMLAHANSIFRHDDLKENAIYVSGENDGSFDQGDFILFYGEAPDVWYLDTNINYFRHIRNLYSRNTAYFITVGSSAGKRISPLNENNLSHNKTITNFDAHLFHEQDIMNEPRTGATWYGEAFDILTTQSFSFTIPNASSNEWLNIRAVVLARSTNPSSFTISSNGNTKNINVNAISGSYTDVYAYTSSDTLGFLNSTSSLQTTFTFNKPVSTAEGWLDYIEINAKRDLIYSNNFISFRSKESVGNGNISEFQLKNASLANVWDISEPSNIYSVPLVDNSSYHYFRCKTDSLKEFIVFSNNDYQSPVFEGNVANQNLHSLSNIDLVIVAADDFVSQAQELADIHAQRDGLITFVTTLDPIYNEFSGGVQDICAIRDFMRMLYDKASQYNELPRYLLLYGDGSFDPLNRYSGETNLIPTYQSINTLNPTTSYVSDDFFGLLDESEGYNCDGDLDIGIGRIPAYTVTMANQMLNKIKRYISTGEISDPSCGNINENNSPFGDWRNNVTFCADDEDGNLHVKQSNLLSAYLDTLDENINIEKIYWDAYPQVSFSGGERYPEATLAINNRVNRGALIVNYTGHGGETGWSKERVLQISDINSWENNWAMPLFITGTCEFTRFDDPTRVSAGEMVYTNANGGAIAMFTTSRIAFSTANYNLNKSMLSMLFSSSNSHKLGDVIKYSKIQNGSNRSLKNFVLLGDPALELIIPENKIEITSIPDTLKALDRVTVIGVVKDIHGNVITDFNGTVYPSIYDKVKTTQTMGNDEDSPIYTYSIQKSILYKGKASVINGQFTFSFIVPYDISYNYGNGRVSLYAEDGEVDARGYYDNFIIGGFTDDSITDEIGPDIQLYMNDDNFVFGGSTDENPMILAYFSDSNGINTVGNGIGHDIVAILDEETENTIVLNDYYEADINTYQSGVVRYPFSELEPGSHTLSLKAWDVLNNSSEVFTEFVVAESTELAIYHLLNYPNPFTTYTEFHFEHNQACCELDVQIQIFTISGKLVKTINQTILTEGFKNTPIQWDATDDYGDKLAKGVYIYKLKIKNNDGKYAEKLEKLVILQ